MGSNGPKLKDHGTEQHLAQMSRECGSDFLTAAESWSEEASSSEIDVCKEESCRVSHRDGPRDVVEELGLLRAAVEKIFDGKHPIEFYIEQLCNEVEGKRNKIKELESEWKEKIESLQEKKEILEQSVAESHPNASEKLVRKGEIELETESVLAEIKRRDEELSRLSSDLEKQTKQSPRKSYIERINEITKNTRKQDTDIQRILKDTRELQIESNNTQERLNRTYAVIDETIFREAKKDSVARQAFRLLRKIHESFEQIAENILTTDRTRRDASDFEAKVAAMDSHGLDLK